MVSEQTMVFISVFGLMHQGAGTMGELTCLYASGGTGSGMQIHAYTHTHRAVVHVKWARKCDLIEILFKL